MPPPSQLINCNNLSSCLQNLYNLLFAFLVAFAFFYFIWGAIEYLFSGISITHKETGKRKMINSIVGLILALIIPTFLYMISPDIFRLTWNIPVVTVSLEPISSPYSSRIPPRIIKRGKTIFMGYRMEDVIQIAREACQEAGFGDVAPLLAILQNETGAGIKEGVMYFDLGIEAGSRDESIERCVEMCFDRRYSHIKLYLCDNLEERRRWCEEQRNALERIAGLLNPDKVPIAPDFGMGYTQFQPTTWKAYRELENRNPWNLKDALYATAIKLKLDGFNENEYRAIQKYNRSEKYWKIYQKRRDDWRSKLKELGIDPKC